MLNNNIGAEQVQNFIAILKEHATLKSLCGNKGDETELDMSGKEMGADGAVMLAPEIVANGALTSLDISSNDIGQLVPPEGWTKQYEHFEGEWQDVFTHTDGTKQTWDPGSKPEGAIAIAHAISANGALETITFGDNQAVTMNTSMTEADFSGKYLAASGAIIVAAFLPKCQ